MSLHRLNPKRDANEFQICTTLRTLGCRVLRLSGKGVPDLAVYSRGRWYLVEVKTEKGKLTAEQKHWGPEVKVWRSVDQAVQELGLIT